MKSYATFKSCLMFAVPSPPSVLNTLPMPQPHHVHNDLFEYFSSPPFFGGAPLNKRQKRMTCVADQQRIIVVSIPHFRVKLTDDVQSF